MTAKPRFILITITVLMVFVFSAMWINPALADDSTPPPPVETPSEVFPQGEEAVVADVPTLPPELLNQLTEGTEVVVVNESSEVIPLASQEAAQAILVADPIWCPTGVAPKPNTGGCSSSQPNLSTLVGAFIPTKAGTIWIENVPDNGSAVVINGAGLWAPAANFSLTLQGGWIGGLSGSKTVLGVSTFYDPINIINWNGAVTVNDIIMNGASNPSYPSTGALNVQTSKNIVLSNVTAFNTLGGTTNGASLNNTSSTTQATVTVKNSSFNNNTNFGGLYINSDGAVTLTNVNANNNFEFGVYIQNNSDAVASAVTVTNSSFNGNVIDATPAAQAGLEIYSNGAITLSQVTANLNNHYRSGIYVDNSFASSAQPVTVTGSLTALYNYGNGLYIRSKGIVNLANLVTNHNLGYGTFIDNSLGAPMAVNITGNNMFNDNRYGLTVLSRGAITINNLTAMGNGTAANDTGVYLANNYDTAKPQSITLKGYSLFQSNSYHGLEVYSYGAITVNNITAQDNGFTVTDGYGSGVVLVNSGALAAKPANITVNGTNSFTHNDGYGINAVSLGIISFSNITASNNGSYGAYLDNDLGITKAVILNGNNTFNQNVQTGLVVSSKGAITLNNVTACNNVVSGASLYNYYGGKSPVTISGYGMFESNGSTGLHIISNGAITTNNLTANFNLGNGAYFTTIGILAPQSVTLNGNNNFNFNGNSGNESGLVVFADGAIKLNNVNASYNYSNGVYLDNFTNWNTPVTKFTTFGSVTLTGFGNFSGNGNVGSSIAGPLINNNEGLFVYTHGATTLNNVTANFNSFNDGIGIKADGNVTLVCSSANNNKWGFLLYGAPVNLLTLKGLSAAGNTIINEYFSYVTLVRTRCP